jgi:hypothetical protein
VPLCGFQLLSPNILVFFVGVYNPGHRIYRFATGLYQINAQRTSSIGGLRIAARFLPGSVIPHPVRFNRLRSGLSFLANY